MIYQPWALVITVPTFWMVYVLLRNSKKEQVQRKAPFTDTLLRPPGEGCRLKIENLNDDLNFQVLLVMGPFLFGLILALTPSFDSFSCIVLLPIVGIYTWWAGKRLGKTLEQLRNYRLGFDGERAVGQEINQALSFGCKVYHDIPFPDYNIDHVIVAPSGVYAVETKTRRKGLEKNAHKVKFDGWKLIFPEWEDDHGLEQAQRNAKSLSTWLTKAVGESVRVEPILTLPGWWIDRIGTGEVNVLNPKQIVGFVTQNPRLLLSPQLFKQVCYQLEQKSII